ncbi:MAG TPA: FtsX-like permease family protein, partial [Ktedonobacteraceae bacterium]|nr:FtsX-like permease family protein [Ktedonobacteraceae bacterium]
VKLAKTPPDQLNLPTVNQVWLRTTDNPTILTSLRTSLDSPAFHFLSLADRRLLLSTLQADPLYLILDGVLTLGTITALLLALIGGLLISWVSARSRLINIVTLRALGSTPGQVVGMFAWEQAIVSLMGFILGGGFGILLATSVIPALSFTDINSNLSNEQFFALQSALSAQLVLPPTLPVLAIALLVIYVASLMLMVGVVLQPALGRTLRLNED